MTTISTPDEYAAAVQSLTAAAAAYYEPSGDDDISPLTDLEYDHLLEAVRVFEETSGAVASSDKLAQVAAGEGTGDVPHPSPMLSLDKVTDEDGIRKFLARLHAAQADAGVSLQPKLDGLAIRAVYRDAKLVQVVTRGNGQAGEDVTDRILREQVTVNGLPRYIGTSRPVQFEVRGELLMSTADFAFSNANRVGAGKPAFANPRNAAAGSLRAETLEYDVQFTFVTYDHDLTVDAPDFDSAQFIFADALPHATMSRADEPAEIIDAVQAFGAARPDYAYPTDGIVIKAVEPEVRARLGESHRAPKWAVAYKYEAQTGETVIRDILVEVGRTGNLSFTAVFDPVLVDGSTISRASLHNVEQIAAKDIRIGSRAVVYKANDIIPQVLSVTNGEDTTAWVPPTEDKDGFPYDTNQTIWRSTNPADSVSALIAYAASRDVLDIDGLGREVADALVTEAGVETIADLFSLELDELADLDMGFTSTGNVRRLGKATAGKILANIDAARTQPLNRVITALGIRLTGRTFGRRLASHFRSLDALLGASVEDLMAVEGIAEGRAQVIFDGLRRNTKVIRDLIELGVTSQVDRGADAAALPLAGMTVVVTGSTKGTKLEAYGRNEMNELIERNGGRASGSVSKNTSLLVAGDGAGSKLAKANELGVSVVSPDEFASRLDL